MKQSAEAVSSTDIPGSGRWEWHDPTGRIWDIEVERPVRTLAVVVVDVGLKDSLELAPSD